jgi:hypothetical protein
MIFRRISDYAEVSDCERYSVSASVHLDDRKVKRYLFTAWLRGRTTKDAPTILAVDCSAETCREACREHSKRAAA